jgi:hypothetical protein
MIVLTPFIVKSLLTSLFQREDLPSLEKRGWGDFQIMSILFRSPWKDDTTSPGISREAL